MDVVFPAFLFALGAAIPLAQRRRIEQGWPGWKIALSTLWRGLSLIAFAVFLQHCRPNILDPDLGVWRWWISLLGFLILGLAFGEFPPWIPRPLQRGLNLLGWLLGIILLSQLTYADGSGFSSTRHDIILVVLGNVAIAGTAIWWLTRDQVLGRLGAIALVFALQLSLGEPGWVRSHLDISPIPHLLNLAYLKYLLIVLPATLIGDGLWQMLHQEKFTPGWTRAALWGDRPLGTHLDPHPLDWTSGALAGANPGDRGNFDKFDLVAKTEALQSPGAAAEPMDDLGNLLDCFGRHLRPSSGRNQEGPRHLELSVHHHRNLHLAISQFTNCGRYLSGAIVVYRG